MGRRTAEFRKNYELLVQTIDLYLRHWVHYTIVQPDLLSHGDVSVGQPLDLCAKKAHFVLGIVDFHVDISHHIFRTLDVSKISPIVV